jgi:hypothetical protein
LGKEIRPQQISHCRDIRLTDFLAAIGDEFRRWIVSHLLLLR